MGKHLVGLTRVLLLCAVVLVLPAVTTAQPGQDTTQRRIEELEQWIRAHPGVFDWDVHNELRHLYSVKNPPDLRKSLEHSNVILQHSVMDEYILNILSGWQIGTDTPAARANLLMHAQAFPDLRFIAAACFVKIGDLYTEEGNLEEATSFYLKVAEDNSPDMAPYRILAEERLSQQEQPLAVPSNVQAEEIMHEGRLSTRVSWTDNVDNELGYVVVDQNRPQEYEADQVPGVGATGSIILPFASCFRVYAYNDSGRSALSYAICTGEVTAVGTIRQANVSGCQQGSHQLVDPISEQVTYDLTSDTVDLSQYEGMLMRVIGEASEGITCGRPILTVRAVTPSEGILLTRTLKTKSYGNA
jgi:hypothetical protein